MIIFLALVALLTSAITAFLGAGGGLLLLATLAFFLPAAAIVPVHSMVQLASNVSRVAFSLHAVQYHFLLSFFLGGLLGMAVFSLLLRYVSFEYLPLFIGGYILLSQWSTWFNRQVARLESFFILGFIHVGAGTLVGTLGPVHMALVIKRVDNHHQVVATVAAMATISNILKIIAFVLAGVDLWAFWHVMLGMAITAIIGSYLGTKIRHKADTTRFQLAMKVLLSVLAVQMLVRFFWG